MSDSLTVAYSAEIPLSELGIDVPAWIEQDIYSAQVAAIVHGGCASGAYMPAVTYHEARATMAEHGDDVLASIEMPATTWHDVTWSELCRVVLSTAVEAWAGSIIDEVAEAMAEDE